jgi:tyrosyl-tRNA synthetase
MSGIFDTLVERGYVANTTGENEIRDLLEKSKTTFYIGFDPTADSLHAGHFLQMVVMSLLQKAGHRPIAIIGGGTAMVGDPSGRTDMRKMLTMEEIDHNAECFKSQLSKLVDFSEGKALMVNNADWLLNLNYVSFLREIGVHFSVNRMLTAECFKSRLEKGLSFIEFNYMLMQGYDFLKLYQDFGCRLELGGDDQWSNILAGTELIRRVEGVDAFGMTFNLLTTSDGRKMGKTARGALWLDPAKTSPYEFYQYWRNVGDSDVIKCLKLLTFVPMDEINRLAELKDQEINEAKKLLAFEVTKMIHGSDEAVKSQDAATAMFENSGAGTGVPCTILSSFALGDNMNILDILLCTGLAPSKSEARRLITQGGITINDVKVTSLDYFLDADELKTAGSEGFIIKKGKKSFHRITVEG